MGLRDIGVLLAMKKGSHGDYDKVKMKECTKVHVACTEEKERVSIEIDGDLCGVLPATFEIIPQALHFVINENFLHSC